MKTGLLTFFVSSLVVILLAQPALAEFNGAADRPDVSPMSLKLGTFLLGDDTAGRYFGNTRLSAGVEYQLLGLNIGLRSRTSAYLDFAYGSGPFGNLSMYSTGIAHRLGVGRSSRRGAYPYLGVALGANVNVFSAPNQTGIMRQASFAQKLMAGVRRGDGTYYEVYFRAAPQNAGIITSGLGFSLGYNL